MKSIIRKELKLLLKGKGNFFFLILMPMLFMVLFGSVFSGAANGNLSVNYLDQDQSAVSQRFIQGVGKVDGFELKQDSASLADQLQKIQEGKLNSLVVIPKGFGENVAKGAAAKILLYHDPTDTATTGPIQTVLAAIANEYQTQHMSQVLVAAGKSPTEAAQLIQPSIQIQPIAETAQKGEKLTMITQVVPGYTVMFVFFILMSMMRSFIGEKESGMLARLRSTPMRPIMYLMGMWIPAILAVLVQCVVLLGFGHFAYDVKLGDLSAMAVIVLCLAICGTGIGLAVSLLIRGENQGRGITMLITLGGAAVGGVWMPSQLMPHFAQVIGYFTPQYWAQQGFQDVMLRGAHVGDVWQSLVILFAFGIAGLLVALLRFPKFLQSATN